MQLKLDKDFKDFGEKLDTLKNNFPRRMEAFLKLQAEETVGNVKNFTPVDTGSLKGGWFRKNGSNKLQQVIYNDVEYVNHIEFGHRVGRSKSKVKPGVYMLKRAVAVREKKFYKDLYVAFEKELKDL